MSFSVNSHLGLWVVASMASGFVAGRVFPHLALQPLIPVTLFMMIFPAMLDLESQKIRQAFVNPGLLVISQLLNFVLAPLLIFSISRLILCNSGGLITGATIFAVIPCGGMVPAYTGILVGNVSLAVSIVATSLILSVGLAPVWVQLLAGESIQIPFSMMAGFLTTCIILPMIAAYMLRRYVIAGKGPAVYEAFKNQLRPLSGYGLVLMVFIVFVSNEKLLSKEPMVIMKVLIAALLFFLAQIAGSILLAKAARSSYPDFIALVISCTAKNTALAMALATVYFGAEASLVVAVAGPMVQLPGMLGFLKMASIFKPV